MLNVESTTYLAAYFLDKAPDKSLARRKLMKLLYLADRVSLERTGFSISFDTYAAEKNGPVLSETHNIIKAAAIHSPDTPEVWDELITTDESKCSLKDNLTEPIRLSVFAERVADQIWAEHGDKTADELTAFTHSLPEWQAPEGDSAPLRIKTIMLACGSSEEDANYFDEEHESIGKSLQWLDDPTTC